MYHSLDCPKRIASNSQKFEVVWQTFVSLVAEGMVEGGHSSRPPNYASKISPFPTLRSVGEQGQEVAEAFGGLSRGCYGDAIRFRGPRPLRFCPVNIIVIMPIHDSNYACLVSGHGTAGTRVLQEWSGLWQSCTSKGSLWDSFGCHVGWLRQHRRRALTPRELHVFDCALHPQRAGIPPE